jgi:selenocysteine lyase/cysteine desulfurase
VSNYIITEVNSSRNCSFIDIYTPSENVLWSGIISFTVEDISPQAIEAALGAKGVAVRAGLHCAPWAHRWLGTMDKGGTVRVSFGCFNGVAEVEEFVLVMGEMVGDGV